jgi:hypothetical protein
MSPFIIQNAPDTGASMLYVFTQLRGSRKPVPPATSVHEPCGRREPPVAPWPTWVT